MYVTASNRHVNVEIHVPVERVMSRSIMLLQNTNSGALVAFKRHVVHNVIYPCSISPDLC